MIPNKEADINIRSKCKSLNDIKHLNNSICNKSLSTVHNEKLNRIMEDCYIEKP